MYPKRVLVCVDGPHCQKLSPLPEQLFDAVQKAISEKDLAEKFELFRVGCLGNCASGPNLRVRADGRRYIPYCRLSPEDAAEIISTQAGENQQT